MLQCKWGMANTKCIMLQVNKHACCIIDTKWELYKIKQNKYVHECFDPSTAPYGWFSWVAALL